MKKSFFVAMVLFIFSCAVASPVTANDSIIITSSESVYVAPNAEFSVDVEVKNASDLVGFQMNLLYNETLFIYGGIEKSDTLGNNITVNSNIEGALTLNYVDVSNIINGDTLLFTLTFTATNLVSEGSQAIITLDETYNNEFIRYTSSNIAEIQNIIFDFNPITRGIYGDVNFDETVSIMDVAIMQLYIANLYEFTPTQLVLADVNGDGKVSVTDVALVQLYIAGLLTSLDPT